MTQCIRVDVTGTPKFLNFLRTSHVWFWMKMGSWNLLISRSLITGTNGDVNEMWNKNKILQYPRHGERVVMFRDTSILQMSNEVNSRRSEKLMYHNLSDCILIAN